MPVPASELSVSDVNVFEGDENLSSSEADFVNAQLKNDPDYQEILRLEKESLKNTDDSTNDNPADGNLPGEPMADSVPDDDDDNPKADDKEIPAELEVLDRKSLKAIILDDELDIQVTKDMTDDQIREAIAAAREAAPAQSGDPADDDDDVEFEDNIIEGLKGADFGAMTKEGRAAVAGYYEKTKALETEKTKAQTELDALLADPIVQHRREIMTNGMAQSQYQIPEMTKEEVQKILNEPDDSRAAELVNQAAQRMAGVVLNNKMIVESQRQTAEKVDKAGSAILLAAGNLHPQFKVKETDISKLKPGHPEFENYKKSHQEIVKYCSERNMKFDALAKMKPESLYALVATENGWPVAFNTQKRDMQIRADATRDALTPFLKQKKKGEATPMPAAGRDSSQKKSGGANKDGIDEIRLATDDNYHDQVLRRRPFDEKWLDKVGEMREAGERKLANKKK